MIQIAINMGPATKTDEVGEKWGALTSTGGVSALMTECPTILIAGEVKGRARPRVD